MAADVKAPRIVRSITNMEEAASAARARAKLSLRFGKSAPVAIGGPK